MKYTAPDTFYKAFTAGQMDTFPSDTENYLDEQRKL